MPNTSRKVESMCRAFWLREYNAASELASQLADEILAAGGVGPNADNAPQSLVLKFHNAQNRAATIAEALKTGNISPAPLSVRRTTL